MNFLRPVSRVACCKISNDVLASAEVKAGKSRHAILVTSKGTSYIGSKKDIENNTGIRLTDGERMFFPIESSRYDQFVVKGTAELAEFF